MFVEKNDIVIDVRTPEEYASGHFEGSLNIPLPEFEKRLTEFDKEKKYFLYCAVGGRSGKAEEIMRKHGYKNVVNAINYKNLQSL